MNSLIFYPLLAITLFVGLGTVFSFDSWWFTNDFWGESVTGQIVTSVARPIYDSEFVSQQAQSTLACIDEAIGSIEGYSAFDAQVGLLDCNV